MRAAVLKRMSEADLAIIDRAVEYAQEKHNSQKRKDGSP